MAAKISAGRLRLVCREVAGKVAARRGREQTSEEAVLRELLRRVESHLGLKPCDLSRHAGDGVRGIREEIDRLFDASNGASWEPIVDEELLAGLFPESRTSGKRGATGSGAQERA